MADRAARTGLAVDVSIDLAWEQGRATHRHTSELETAIYRIVQEALTNATKHGHASRAVVQLTEADRGVDIRVRDDGNGFESQPRPRVSVWSACGNAPSCWAGL